MLNPDELQKFINGIGAFAEICTMYYRACLKTGLSREDSLELTKAFIGGLVANNFSQRKDDNNQN